MTYIISTGSKDIVTHDVRALQKEGWTPIGGITIINGEFHQALVKNEAHSKPDSKDGTPNGTETNRRRGRPPGSKNRPKKEA